MKKTVFALAALTAISFAGVAHAENSVTMYGVGDVWIGSKPGELSKDVRFVPGSPNRLVIDREDQFAVESGGLSGSRWGILVKEDLGTGLTGFVNFESGVNIDTGENAQGELAFGRKAVIGLGSASWGKVSFGRQYTAYDDAFGLISAQGNDSFDSAGGLSSNALGDFESNRTMYKPKINTAALANNVTLTDKQLDKYATQAAFAAMRSTKVGAWVGYTGRYDNSIRYETPNFDGFSGAITVGLGENKTSSTKATNNVSLHAKYANGPLALAFAYQVDKSYVSGYTKATQQKNTLIGGTYDFGMLTAHAAFNKTSGTGIVLPSGLTLSPDAKEFLLGVTVPFDQYKIIGQLAHSKLDMGAKSMSFGLEGHYSLSKRTTAYAAFTQAVTKYNGDESKARVVAAGMRHKF